MRSLRGTTRRGRESGVALLNALVIISVVTGVTARLLRDDVDAYARFEMMIRSNQARQYALGAVWLASDLLRTDGENGGTDHLDESWAKTDRVFPLEAGFVRVRIVDLQGRLNLNSVAGPDGLLRQPVYDQLERLFDAAGAPPRTATAVAEWVMSNPPPLPGRRGDGPYLSAKPPYRRPREPMTGSTELRLMVDITASAYRRLRPLVTALPVPTDINVNTSPAPVLKALAPGIDDRVVEAILKSRAESPFISPAEFHRRMAARIPPRVAEELEHTPVTVFSNWFLIDCEAQAGSGRARVVTVVQRSSENGVSALLRLEERP